MGEVAVAVEAFREQFDAGIASLTPDIAVRPTRARFLGPSRLFSISALTPARPFPASPQRRRWRRPGSSNRG